MNFLLGSKLFFSNLVEEAKLLLSIRMEVVWCSHKKKNCHNEVKKKIQETKKELGSKMKKQIDDILEREMTKQNIDAFDKRIILKVMIIIFSHFIYSFTIQFGDIFLSSMSFGSIKLF